MRGTDPCIYYDMPFGQAMVAKALLTVHHSGRQLLKRDLSGMHWKENNRLCIPLSREETLQLPDDAHVQLQLQIETPAGDYLVAAPQWLYTGILLSEEALQ